MFFSHSAACSQFSCVWQAYFCATWFVPGVCSGEAALWGFPLNRYANQCRDLS
jgi:hypothetical protein